MVTLTPKPFEDKQRSVAAQKMNQPSLILRIRCSTFVLWCYKVCIAICTLSGKTFSFKLDCSYFAGGMLTLFGPVVWSESRLRGCSRALCKLTNKI